MLTHYKTTIFTLLSIIICTTGCARTIRQKGYTFNQAHIEQIKPHISSKDTVFEILGSPSVESSFGDDTWFYISTKRASLAFFAPKILEQQIVSIEFGPDNLVKKIDKYTLDHAQTLAFSKDKTPTAGDDDRLVKKLFGNMGRFNKDSKNRKVSSSKNQ